MKFIIMLTITGPGDYTSVFNMVFNFQPASASERQCGNLQLMDDSALESAEIFRVALISFDRGVVTDPGTATATVSITDNDRKSEYYIGNRSVICSIREKSVAFGSYKLLSVSECN